MTVRGSCVPFDRLTALALAAQAPGTDHDRQMLTHVSTCESCAARLADLTVQMETLRDAAWQEADAAFDDAMLEAQRGKILARLANLGKAARVLRFPSRMRDASMPVSPISRRWVSVAAAAGLIIGLVAGQLLHFVPWESQLHRQTGQLQAPTPRPQSGPVIVQNAAAVVSLTDDELLDEIDEAMELRRAPNLRALDAFTPRVGDLVEIR
jgi:hypothetical protein